LKGVSELDFINGKQNDRRKPRSNIKEQDAKIGSRLERRYFLDILLGLTIDREARKADLEERLKSVNAVIEGFHSHFQG